MITRQTIASILTTTAIAFAIGSPAAAESFAAAAAHAAPPAGGEDTDHRTQKEIKDALGQDPELDDAHIAVTARAGRVTLVGVARTEEQRVRAQRTAEAVRGVRAIDNAIEVVAR